VIAAGRDVKQDGATLQLDSPQGGQCVVNKEDVLHVLEQEIGRLTYFRDAPPKGPSPEEVARLRDLEQGARIAEGQEKVNQARTGEEGKQARREMMRTRSPDTAWQVVLVELSFAGRAKDVVSYGEMNTLADIFGSPEEMTQTDSKRFHQILQGIRHQTLFNMMNLHKEISGKNKYVSKLNPLKVGEGFSGSVGGTGRQTGSLGFVGERRLMGIGGKGKLAFGENAQPKSGEQETSDTSTLGRNACHFAPESWHAWASYHQKAEKLALDAWRATENAAELRDDVQKNEQSGVDLGKINELLEKQATISDKRARAAANEALLQNGFGDHYLQDSYAAGHLINKTEIMKWFVLWTDANPKYRPIRSEDQWRRLKAIATRQGGIGADPGQYDKDHPGQTHARDPQSVENLEGDWQFRFQALGLTVPTSLRVGTPAQKLFLWWQETPNLFEKMSVQKVQDHERLSDRQAKTILLDLVRDGVARINRKKEKSTDEPLYTIEERYRPRKDNRGRFATTTTKLKSNDVNQQQQGAQEYERMGAAVTYADYHEFLNNAYLQASTNVLHGKFCREGLWVASGAKGEAF
jgi:hypothetical protein